MVGRDYGLKRFLAGHMILLITLFASSCGGVSAGAVRKAIKKNLPSGSTAAQVIAFLNARGIEYGEIRTYPTDSWYPGEHNIRLIPAAIRKQGFLFEKTISIAFRLDEKDRLIDYKIKESLTGP